jgi:hypothetical protein
MQTHVPGPLLVLCEREDRLEAQATGVPAVKPWRLVRATAKAQWYVIRETLKGRERAVYWGLMGYWNRHQDWPTGMELLEFLLEHKAKNPKHPRYRLITDVNSVRPRLTGLNQREPALVVTGPKRHCTSNYEKGKEHHLQVLTWRIPQLGEAVRSGAPSNGTVAA